MPFPKRNYLVKYRIIEKETEKVVYQKEETINSWSLSGVRSTISRSLPLPYYDHLATRPWKGEWNDPGYKESRVYKLELQSFKRE